ncbi:DoxX family protein [Sandaracinus amylolyticus]|uniref:DoxX family protein n=1 Tax=Sandaracinus amylolyticus TaxID=927083 RepID=UPI001F3684E4|nr:DoxX family protein [Sandaracinus amylolyticus]UJR84536.1 Hypothetical protein I5071_66150 [Sandaracinus amylolyticus]
MAPLIVLIGTFTILGLVGRGRWPWHVSLRIALAAMFVLTGSAHFAFLRDDMIRMVPPIFPRPDLMVTLTGIAELAGALGLLIPRTAPWAAGCLVVLMLAMFPANVHAALSGIPFDGQPPTPLLFRTLEEIVFLAAGIAAAIPDRVSAVLRGQTRSLTGVAASRDR